MFNYSTESKSNVSTINHEKFGGVRQPVFYDLPFTICMALVAVITSLLTISGNLIVLLSFILERSIRQPSNYFIASLAVSDLLIGAVSIPFYAAYLLSGHYWLLGEILCDVWLSIDYSACLCSIYTVFCITIDRYCSVKIPAKYRAWRSRRKILFIIAIIWTIPVSMFFTSIFGWQYFTGKRDLEIGECDVQYMKNAVFNSLLQIGYFWVTLFFMVALYVGIYRVVLRLQKKSEEKREKIARLVVSASSAKVVKPQSTVIIPQPADEGVSQLGQEVIVCSDDQKDNEIEQESSKCNTNFKKCFLDGATSISFIQENNKVDENELIGEHAEAQICDLLNENVRGENKTESYNDKKHNIIIKVDSCIGKIENSKKKKLELYLQHQPQTVSKKERKINFLLKKNNKEENENKEIQNNEKEKYEEKQYRDAASETLLHVPPTNFCCDSDQWDNKNNFDICEVKNFSNNGTSDNKKETKCKNKKIKHMYKNKNQQTNSIFEKKTHFSKKKELSIFQKVFDKKDSYTMEDSVLNPVVQEVGSCGKKPKYFHK